MSKSFSRTIVGLNLISVLTIIGVLTGCFGFFFSVTHFKNYSLQVDTLRSNIYKSKMDFIRNTVERTISDIEKERLMCDECLRHLEESAGPVERDVLQPVCSGEQVRERIKARIRSTQLIDDGYIWINKVLDYNGGDGYAVRLVHPNKVATEGMLLSTAMTDIKGNTPYLTELEGVKENGELFFEYWFKKKNSLTISRKLTFAKLYKDYDWIIATGVHLDDVEAVIAAQKKQLDADFHKQLLNIVAAGLLAAMAMTLVVLFFQRRIFRVIDSYIDEVAEKERTISAINADLEHRVLERTRAIADSEVRLIESEERFSLAMEASRDGLWDWNVRTGDTYHSPGYAKIFGFPSGEGPEHVDSWMDLVHPEDRALALKLRCDCEENRRDDFCVQLRMQAVNGEWRWILSRGKVVERDVHGRADRMVGTLTDITDLRRVEDDLRLNDIRLEELLRLSRMSMGNMNEITGFALEEAIRLTNSQIGYLAFVNEDESVLTMHRWSEKTLEMCAMGERPVDYAVGETGMWGETIRQRGPVIVNDHKGGPLSGSRCPRGHVPITRHMNIPVFDGERIVAVVGVGNKHEDYNGSDLRQMTLLMQGMWRLIQQVRAHEEKMELEKQLRQAQKMEAIGTLAGGIAHDFNNILVPIMGFGEMLQEDLSPGTPEHKYVGAILQAALRARELVRQILTFSRRGERDIRPVKLQLILREALKLLESSIPKTIRIETAIESDCAAVSADPTQMHQIIMNLATNSYHAMEASGGDLRISLEETKMETAPVGLPELRAGNYALLRVVDTGIGIHENLMDKLFDPYFTTKENDKGTGLGLSVVQGIVRDCGGEIRICSEWGTGTEVHVYLPIFEAVPDEGSPDALLPLQRGSERILLVDDEREIVDMGKIMLERLGYHVTSENDSLSALGLFKENPDLFDLVISDMTMPKMTGVQLAHEIKAVRGDLPFIICTGFSDHINEKESIELGIQGYVMKPFVQRVLSQTVRDVLDRSGKSRASVSQ